MISLCGTETEIEKNGNICHLRRSYVIYLISNNTSVCLAAVHLSSVEQRSHHSHRLVQCYWLLRSSKWTSSSSASPENEQHGSSSWNRCDLKSNSLLSLVYSVNMCTMTWVFNHKFFAFIELLRSSKSTVLWPE